MATVPNWIAKAVVHISPRGMGDHEVYPIESWRATNTQVVVTYHITRYSTAREARFRLDDLRLVGPADRIYLVNPDDPASAAIIAQVNARTAVEDLRSALASNRLDRGDLNALLTSVIAIHDSAARAMAEIGKAL